MIHEQHKQPLHQLCLVESMYHFLRQRFHCSFGIYGKERTKFIDWLNTHVWTNTKRTHSRISVLWLIWCNGRLLWYNLCQWFGWLWSCSHNGNKQCKSNDEFHVEMFFVFRFFLEKYFIRLITSRTDPFLMLNRWTVVQFIWKFPNAHVRCPPFFFISHPKCLSPK